ncbi:homeobox protein engrailed-1-like, partial [Meleagris gallopavo]|uniref:homeobox protein engrailed-1-like n=1 Tax=Meleagris gallopavo TaxID=9103 RepID=UPI000938FC24
PAAKYGEHGSPAILLMGSNNGGAVLKPDSQQPLVWPAWVSCTRYSDRPSSGKDSADPPSLPRAPLPCASLLRLSARRGEGPGPHPPPRAPFVSARRRGRAKSGVPRESVPLPQAKCIFRGGRSSPV